MSGAMVDGFYVRGSVSATNHLQVVEVSVVLDVLDSPDRARLLISPADALSLARNLVTSAEAALARQLYDAKAGDCATCGNERIVHQPRPGGSTERVHCPDCVPRTNEPIPVMAGWAERTRAVL